MSATIPDDPLAIDRSAPMYGARVKIARAHTHLLEFDRLIAEYPKSNPYRLITRFNEEEQSTSAIVEFDEFPVTFALTFGDCIHNLRAALDLLGVELTRLGLQREGKQMSKSKLDHAGFLICGNRKNFESKFDEATQHWGDTAKTLFRELEPFKDGRHSFSNHLWRLHKLDILDKHKLLIPTATFPSDFRFGVVPQVSSPDQPSGIVEASIRVGVMGAAPGTPLKSGDELFAVLSSDPNLQLRIGGAFGIGLAEDYIVEGVTIMEALNSMMGAVDSIVETMANRT